MEAIVLAAGQSKRLGSPKQLLDFNGQSLLQHCLSIYLKSSLTKLHLVLGANHEQIVESIQIDERISVHLNHDWIHGIGSSIACGMKSINKEFPVATSVMLLLGDQPHIQPHHIDRIIQSFQASSSTIACADYGSKRFGPPVIFSDEHFSELSILDKDEGARSILKKNQHNVCRVKLETFNPTDIDSIEDYRQSLKTFQRKPVDPA